MTNCKWHLELLRWRCLTATASGPLRLQRRTSSSSLANLIRNNHHIPTTRICWGNLASWLLFDFNFRHWSGDVLDTKWTRGPSPFITEVGIHISNTVNRWHHYDWFLTEIQDQDKYIFVFDDWNLGLDVVYLDVSKTRPDWDWVFGHTRNVYFTLFKNTDWLEIILPDSNLWNAVQLHSIPVKSE